MAVRICPWKRRMPITWGGESGTGVTILRGTAARSDSSGSA